MTRLPAGWKTNRLAGVTTIISGQSPPGSSINGDGDGKPFFQGKAEFGSLYPEVRKYTTSPLRSAQKGDILLSVRAPVGPTNIAPLDCAIGRGLAAIRSNHEILDQRFLLWVLRSTEQALADQGTGSTFTAITGKVLRDHTVPLPPLEEQRRIVAILEDHLSHLDAADSGLRAATRRMEALRAAELSATVEWDSDVSTIGSLANVGTGSTPSRSDKENYDGGRIPWVTSGDLHQGVVVRASQNVTDHGQRSGRLKLYPPDTLLVAMYGEGKTRGTVARLGISATVNQACATIKVNDPRLVDWIEVVLQANYSSMRAMAAGGVQPNLNLGLVKKIPVPMPPEHVRLARLDKLSKSLNSLLKTKDTVVDLAARTLLLRRSLLASAFHGDLTADWRAGRVGPSLHDGNDTDEREA